MKRVAKYNTFKGVSTVLTLGTPIVTLACFGDFFIHRSETAISAAGIFAAIIVMLIFKDKFAENWKAPSAFIVSTIMVILILFIEHIILPMKYVCIMTMVSTGIDELIFKRVYKQIEELLPKEAKAYKKIGFLFTHSSTLEQYIKRVDENE